MSVQLNPTTVCVVSRSGGASREFAWSPEAPDTMVDTLRTLVGAPSGIVVVVGLGLLEIAQPDLPPMSPEARRAVLWRDADRYFPIADPVAVVCVDAFALAVSARALNTWIRAIRTVGAVRTIVTTPQVCAQFVGTGMCAVPAGAGERGEVRLRDGRLESVRRAPAAAPDDATAVTTTNPVSPATPDEIGHAALRWIDAPLDDQLLDPALARGIRRSRTQRWLASGVLATASVVLLLWSVDRARDAQRSTLQTAADLLAERAAPAMRAESRLTRANNEVSLLASADSARRGPDAPLLVLAHLSRILPRDAFVQRLEWDGALWRVDGTADNARRLVPLLDGDAQFRDVRIASASQRFLDVGRQRESFAISFRIRPASGGAHGTP